MAFGIIGYKYVCILPGLPGIVARMVKTQKKHVLRTESGLTAVVYVIQENLELFVNAAVATLQLALGMGSVAPMDTVFVMMDFRERHALILKNVQSVVLLKNHVMENFSESV